MLEVNAAVLVKLRKPHRSQDSRGEHDFWPIQVKFYMALFVASSEQNVRI